MGEHTNLIDELAASRVMIRDKHSVAYRLRPIRLSDAPALIRAYDAMSEEAKWFRMLHNVPHLSEGMALQFCSPDPSRDLCLVIEGNGTLIGEILGGARISGLPNREAEFAVSLRPEAQSRGLGRASLLTVLHAAHDKDIEQVWGIIAAHNAPMIGLARALGFVLERDTDDAALIRARMDLRHAIHGLQVPLSCLTNKSLAVKRP
jgi:RimJ/RimL family protein N-acetyltransferase